MNVPGDLVLHVSRPVDQELREAEICKEDDDGEEQISQIDVLLRLSDGAELAARGEKHEDQNGKREAAQSLAGYENESEDRRIVMRLARHDPVDRSERHG